ncbi:MULTISPECIES: DoxX family protein [unclassified Curtobacterium]|uniref:DoxX family protein n=1 Tax=unclassified Curtobacterium TaxID=257496 RepID=UPI000DAAC7E2|nr:MULTISPECIES: DoxX family protein [unclassified Curtobacterium]PZE64180.1 DoxX family protein [Curtobacterium sp. MCPF17_018]PZF26210.1 DoxX family protein [Curtobacterium sp. MCPF17_051]WIB70803.1 DoxX family protein [Curtobacterium sp. MCBD17_026]
MAITFWIVAGLAAVAFFGAGLMKLIRPISALKEAGMGWIEDYSNTTVKLIALAEVVGATGLVLPIATRIAPALSPVAGVALTVIMAGAIAVHVRRKESPIAAIVLTALPLAAAILGFILVFS